MVYGYGAARKMDLRAFILRLREDRIYCGGDHIIVFRFFDFSKLSFWFKIFLSGDFEK